MRNRLPAILSLTLLAAGLAFAGCAAEGPGGAGGNSASAGYYPNWVQRGSGLFAEGGRSSFYGVGIVSGLRNRALAIAAANDTAHKALAETMIKAGAPPSVASSLASGRDRIVDHWADPGTGTMYALARVDAALVPVSTAAAAANEESSKPAPAPERPKEAAKPQDWWAK